MLSYNGEIWLPNMKCIEQYIEKYKQILEKYYTIEFTSNTFLNPLVKATEEINDLLLQDNLNRFVNENQISRLNSSYPFLKLVFNK